MINYNEHPADQWATAAPFFLIGWAEVAQIHIEGQTRHHQRDLKMASFCVLYLLPGCALYYSMWVNTVSLNHFFTVWSRLVFSDNTHTQYSQWLSNPPPTSLTFGNQVFCEPRWQFSPIICLSYSGTTGHAARDLCFTLKEKNRKTTHYMRLKGYYLSALNSSVAFVLSQSFCTGDFVIHRSNWNMNPLHQTH